MANSGQHQMQTSDQRKKRQPGKRCVVMFCNKTNADGVSLHQFPADDNVRRQWIAFVRTKREPRQVPVTSAANILLVTVTKDLVQS